MNTNATGVDVELRALAKSQATICAVFANAKRVMILWSLLEQEKSVGEIASEIEASLQCTSQHLHLMKDMGILDSRREGQTIFYFIIPNGLAERCQLLLHADQRG